MRASIEEEIKARQQERTKAQLALVPLEISERQLSERFREIERLQQAVRLELASVEREVTQIEEMNWLRRFLYTQQRTLGHEEIARRAQLLGHEVQGTYDMKEEKTYIRRLRESVIGIKQMLQRLDEERNAIQSKKLEPLAIFRSADEREADLRKMLEEYPNTHYRNLHAQHQQERDRLAAELYHGEQEIDRIEYEIEQIRDRRNEIAERLEEIERESRLVKERVAANADLIAETLTGVYTNQYLQGRYFDCIIIDEASMAALPVILVAAARATGHVCIIGDPLQLAPITGLNEEQEVPEG